MLEPNIIYNTDCMTALPLIPDKSIDMILCDLPYGISDCAWDKKLDLTALVTQYNRIIKDNAAMVFTATCAFAIDLINANRKYFRYDLVWEKTMATGFANCNRMPMRSHDLVLVFYKHLPTYNPQGLIELKDKREQVKLHHKENIYRTDSLMKPYIKRYANYPRSILKFSNGNHKSLHPTQKPLELWKYLIATYTNPGDAVLDSCAGSFTTAVACEELGRNWICIEKEERYCETGRQRLERLRNVDNG